MTVKQSALVLLSLLTFGASSASFADDGSGLKTSASVDMVGSFKGTKASSAPDEFVIREAEIGLAAPIDQLFQGYLSFAAHREEGEAVAEVHEAYISSSTLIPRSNIRVGQFFLGLGRLNRFHRHEWPIIFAPKVHEEFFGPEGALDSGIEYSFLAPLPFFLETTIGLSNGWTYGHAHDAGEKPKQPTHYGRIASYFELPASGGMQTALNFLSRSDAAGEKTTLSGLDVTAKWREAGLLNFLFQGEVWHRSRKPEGAEEERTLGAYLLPQYAFDSQIFFGLLVHYYSVLSLEDVLGEKVDNSVAGVTPTLTYKASEFSTLRLACDWLYDKQKGREERKDVHLQLQANFVIGAHPAHDF